MRVAILTLALLAVALAGCSDSGDGDGDDMSSSSTSSSSTTSTGSTSSSSTTTTGTQEPPEPIVITGTTSGVIDCQLLGQDQAPVLGDTKSVPAEAGGRSYSLTFTPGTLPAGTSVCLAWDGVAAGNSGSVPEDASEVGVYADGAPDGVSYTLTIE